MDEVQGAGGSPVSEGQSPEEIREQIEATRRDLGDTVEALSAKTDVKAQARQTIDEAKATANQRIEDARATANEYIGRAREASPDSAVAAAESGKEMVRQNPFPTAVAGAFVIGFVFGRLTSRR